MGQSLYVGFGRMHWAHILMLAEVPYRHILHLMATMLFPASWARVLMAWLIAAGDIV